MRSDTLTCLLIFSGCVPALLHDPRAPQTTVPKAFQSPDLTEVSSAKLSARELFDDPKLTSLIDAALQNNQELNIVALEIDIASNEVQSRQGEFLPKVNLKAGAGLEKVGRYTSQGASDEGHGVPEHLPSFGVGLFASWELDVWSKLRSATRAANARYLSSIEGKKFATTVLVGEIANAYYDLVALDAQLEVVKQNLGLQRETLVMVRLQKEAARVTELAVKRFEAEVLKNESRQFAISQQIVAIENRLNFLIGRFPQHVDHQAGGFTALAPAVIHAGLPSQLLENRPDIKRAELELAAAELDVKVARASFYPSLAINAGVGYQAFDILKIITTPASLFYDAAADLMAPLFNRKVITANYFSASSKQMQAVFNYERAILKGYGEAATQVSMIENLAKSYELRAQQVAKLNEAIEISTGLFSSARADYAEVLMTRREALESQLELIETKKQQLNAVVNLYQALGGGWR